MTASIIVPSDEPKRNFTEEEVLNITRKYGGMIQKIIRARLHSGMRSEFDSIDFMQMVWTSIFKNQDWMTGEDDDIANFLSTVAVNKVNMQKRKNLTSKRDRNRSVPLMTDAPSDSLAPDEVVLHYDQLRKLCRNLPKICRQGLFLRLRGWKMHEISDKLGVSERSLRRTMARVRTVYLRLQSDLIELRAPNED